MGRVLEYVVAAFVLVAVVYRMETREVRTAADACPVVVYGAVSQRRVEAKEKEKEKEKEKKERDTHTVASLLSCPFPRVRKSEDRTDCGRLSRDGQRRSFTQKA